MEAEFTLSKQLFLSMDRMKMRYSSLLVTIYCNRTILHTLINNYYFWKRVSKILCLLLLANRSKLSFADAEGRAKIIDIQGTDKTHIIVKQVELIVIILFYNLMRILWVVTEILTC